MRDENGVYFSAQLHQDRLFKMLLDSDAKTALKAKYSTIKSGTRDERNKLAMEMLADEVNGKLEPFSDMSIHDMFQAALPDGYFQVSRFGHKKPGYFQTKGVQESEAFAEMLAAQLTDERSWSIMKEYFPHATEMFESMVKEALNE